MKTLLILLIFCGCFAGKNFCQSKKLLSNQDILSLHNSGISDTLVINAIKIAPATNFNIDAASVIDLHKNGISEPIINAMFQRQKNAPASDDSLIISQRAIADSLMKITAQGNENKPANPYANLGFGLYTAQGNVFKAFQSSVFSTTTSNSFLHRNLSGFINEKTKASLPNKTSANIIAARDTIIFILEQTSSAASTVNLTAPADFLLVKLEAKKSSREITISKDNALGSSDGVAENEKLPFISMPVSNGVFKVYFTAGISPGEYAFFPASKLAREIFTKVYDFTIQ